MRTPKNIRAQVIGGQQKDLDNVTTVEEAFTALGLDGDYSATVNGDPVDFDYELSDYEFVAFSANVKGGC